MNIRFFSITIAFSMLMFGLWFLPNIYNAKGDLLSVDHIIGLKNIVLLKLGVSGDPENVVVGKDGFLFLSDRHNASYRRYGNMRDETHLTKALNESLAKLKIESVNSSVPLLAYVVPSKASVYNENLPFYVQGDRPPFSYVDDFLADTDYIVTFKNRIRENKQLGLLYMKADTHWNNLGAYLGYLSVIDHLNSHLETNLIKFEVGIDGFEHQYKQLSGDLLNYLKVNKLPGVLSEIVLPAGKDTVKIATEYTNLSIIQTRLEKKTLGVIEDSSEKKGFVFSETNHQPLKTANLGAPNQKSVLWLTDSFGTAMSAYMYYTFENVFQIHPRFIKSPEQLGDFFAANDIDIIIIAIAERQAFNTMHRIAPHIEKGLRINRESL